MAKKFFTDESFATFVNEIKTYTDEAVPEEMTAQQVDDVCGELSDTGGGIISGVANVDDALSTTSTNPVQNKVVATALDAKVPATRTINGKALSADITLAASDVGAFSAEDGAYVRDAFFSTSPGSLTFDGNLDGRYSILGASDTNYEAYFVHVSDEYPEIVSLSLGQTVDDQAWFGMSTPEGVAGSLVPYTVSEDGFCIVGNDEFGEIAFIVPSDNYSPAELGGLVTFEKKGVYFIAHYMLGMGMRIPFMYVSGLKIFGHSFKSQSVNSDLLMDVEVEGASDTITFKNYQTVEEIIADYPVYMDDGSVKLFKISNSLLNIEDLQGGISYQTYGGISETIPYSDISSGHIAIDENGSFLFSPFCIIKEDNTVFSDLTFPEAGIYLGMYNNVVLGIKKITLHGNNVFSGTKKQVNPEYLSDILVDVEGASDTITFKQYETTEEIIADYPVYVEYDDYVLNKVSNVPLRIEDLQNGITYKVFGEESGFIPYSDFSQIVSSVITDNNSFIFELFTIIQEDNTVIDGITFYQAGIYVPLVLGIEMLTFHGNNVFGSKRQINPEYLPETLGGSGLPAVAESDNGKFLSVVDGVWAAVAIPNAEEAKF